MLHPGWSGRDGPQKAGPDRTPAMPTGANLTREALRAFYPPERRKQCSGRPPARHAAALLIHRCSSPPHVAHRCRPAWST